MTLSTSGMNKKVIWSYLLISIFTVVVSQIYSVFSHDVSSPSMIWMFLYPLIGGAIYYFIITKFISISRLSFNLHNSGIATLTIASFLQGVFEIAGTNSSYLQLYRVIGWGMILVAFIILMSLNFFVKKV